MLLAILIVLPFLGMLPLKGAEGRWAVIARSMLRSGDLFTPMLGIMPYWDKPLLSYWQILPFSWLTGNVSELTARLPSAIWGLVMLILTFDMAKTRFGIKTAFYSSLLLLSTYGFVEWARDAQVEMTNAGCFLLCMWFFFKHKSDKSQIWMLILGLLMAINANMKGLVAFGLPVICILAYMISTRDISWFPSFGKLFAVGLISLTAFLILPIIASILESSWNPLYMVWKENVVRFFDPFDHKGAIYTYFIHIFNLAAPWSLFLPLAGIYYSSKKQFQDRHVKEILSCAVGTFIFFTLCGSRRSYYLLPILPFTSILLGRFLVAFQNMELSKKLQISVISVCIIISIIVGIVIGLPLIALFTPLPGNIPDIKSLWPISFAILATAGAVIVGSYKHRPLAILAGVTATWILYIFVLIPWLSSQYTDVAQITTLKEKADSFGFIDSDNAKVIFYLDKPYKLFKSRDVARSWAQNGNRVVIQNNNRDYPGWDVVVRSDKWQALKPSKINNK